MPRFRVRTLMISVAVVALLIAAIGPVKSMCRRWSYHRSQVDRFARLEAVERLNSDREQVVASDRDAIRATLATMPGFATKSVEQQKRIIDGTAEFHKSQAAQSLASAKRWAEQRRDSQSAMWLCWDPFAPDAP